jgi:hypothetical protein
MTRARARPCSAFRFERLSLKGETILSAAIEWGSTAEERAARYPCEEFVPDPRIAVFRAIDMR